MKEHPKPREDSEERKKKKNKGLAWFNNKSFWDYHSRRVNLGVTHNPKFSTPPNPWLWQERTLKKHPRLHDAAAGDVRGQLRRALSPVANRALPVPCCLVFIGRGTGGSLGEHSHEGWPCWRWMVTRPVSLGVDFSITPCQLPVLQHATRPLCVSIASPSVT